jgi:FkbM family methyltransferase
MSLVQTLARKLFPHGAVRTVLRGPLRGTRFVVVPGMAATYALGVDSMNWRFLAERLHAGDVVYDIGGNCGQMALFFSRSVGAASKVYTFEPVPQNAATLRRNLALNACGNVEVIEAAVAADTLPRTFCFDAAHHTMGTLEGAMVKLAVWDTTFQVACVTLDGMIAQGARPPQVLKIDVEGAGLGVIEGAGELIERHRPAIYFELHAADENAPELQAVRWLRERWGYRVTDLNGTLQNELSPMWGGAVWCEPRAGG